MKAETKDISVSSDSGQVRLLEQGSQACPRRPGAGCEADYLRIAASRKDDGALDATILRTASINGRELLAWQASAGRLRYQDFLVYVEAFRDPVRRPTVLDWIYDLEPRWTIRLARVMALQWIEPDDRLNALVLFRLVIDAYGPDVVTKKQAKEFCDLAIAMGESFLARAWSRRLDMQKTARAFVETDLCNPFVNAGCGDEAPWRASFGRIFSQKGLEPPRLVPDSVKDAPPFERLSAEPVEHVQGGPLVTIAVSSYKPGRALVTSLKSLIEQSWRNIEVLLMDDASPEEFVPLLMECEALDPRIRLLRMPKNGGTYRARNAALDAARGEFFTTQDSDDWSHPRRIQVQVEALLRDPGRIGCKVQGVRTSEDLVLGRPASDTLQENASSLMFRRLPAIQRIGYFDSVRKGADTEYALRLELVFGPIEAIKLPLSIIRITTASLSRSDFKPNWRHPARVAYRGAYDYWHKKIREGRAGIYRGNSEDNRPFPAPRAFWIDRQAAAEVQEYDFVFIGDWRQYGGPQKSMLEEIRALSGRGLSIGVCHMEAFRFMTKERKPLCDAVRELVHTGAVKEVLRTDSAVVKMMVLRYPLILQYTPSEPFAWQIMKGMIVANQPPHHHDGSDLRYNVAECIRNAKALFGIHPIWVPQGPQVRAAVAPLLPVELLDEEDVPGILAVDEWQVEQRRLRDSVPVIGRYSRDNPIKFPSDASTLLAAYPAAPDIRVRIMGGAKSCEAVLGSRSWPGNWEMLDYDQEPVEAFLDSIDFFVNFDNDDNIEAFGRSMLEAMASGCVVILPHKFRQLFGEGAVYADASEVEQLVRKLHADQAAYSDLSRKALKHVQDHFSHDAYARRMLSAIKAQ